MRPTATPALALLLLFASATLFRAAATPAPEDVYPDEYEESARVMRISLLRGEVSLRRAGNVEWERAKLNLPLVEGDTLATGRDARLEIQLDARNFVRVGADSVLRVVTLRDEGVALSLSEGTATVSLARFDHEREYFEVDAPKTTVAAEKRGLYRLDVSSDGGVRVTVREDGRARIYSETSGFTLRNKRTARLSYDGQDEGDWELSQAAGFDEWDYWVDERERYLASRLRHEDRERYYDREVWGAEELDAYGDWSYTQQYGYVWRPHLTVVNNYYNWAPYRYGHWRWCPPFGWTWVGDEPWGWAPYHYGRWVYVNNYWCWAPRGYGYNYRRAWWRPALVVFVQFGSSHDHHIAWYPLGHGQRDPRGRWWEPRRDRLTPLRAGEVANLRRTNPALLRAVTTLPARDFGAEGTRARPAPAELAQRAVAGEPIRGRFPVVPATAGRANVTPGTQGRAVTPFERANTSQSATEGERPTLRIARPAPLLPPRAVPDRPTGAAARAPGVRLDPELRRTRVFQGREPRVAPPDSSGGGEGTGERVTGVVTRPVPVAPRVPAGGGPSERVNPAERVNPEESSRPEPRRQPAERVRPAERDGEDGGDTPAPRVRRAPSEDRPSAPPVYARPEPRERPSEPVERPQAPPRRQEPPSARPERPREERAPAPRQEPPAHVEQPAPRQEERPAPSAPPQRSEPPPQRSEPRERPAPPARAPERSPERAPRPRDEHPR